MSARGAGKSDQSIEVAREKTLEDLVLESQAASVSITVFGFLHGGIVISWMFVDHCIGSELLKLVRFFQQIRGLDQKILNYTVETYIVQLFDSIHVTVLAFHCLLEFV